MLIGCDHFGDRTLKLIVYQEGINEINWFFALWYKFRKARSYFNNCCVDIEIGLAI